MKKKAFAVFAAALTALCCLAAPSAAAESQYQMGDVNRDGRVSLNDAQLALREYCTSTLGQHPLGTFLDDEQRALAMVGDRSTMSEEAQDHVVFQDALMILWYYTCYVAQITDDSVGVIEFYKQNPNDWHTVDVLSEPKAR